MKKTIQLFPSLVEETDKMRDILISGSDHAPRTRKRRLPWRLFSNDQQQRSPALLSQSSSCPRSPYCGSLSSGSGADGRGGLSISTTCKKTIESLSSSVYEEMQPFRRAHQTLIKNRMAMKSANNKWPTATCFSRLHKSADSRSRRNSSRSSSRSSSSGGSERGRPARSRKQKQSPLESGLAKITLCASSFAWRYGRRSINGFQRTRMLPVEFKEQLQMALHIYLRPAEGTAVTRFFDVENVGSINGEYFVRWFLQAGLDSREQRLREQAAEDHEERRLRRQRQGEEEARQRNANTAAVEVDFSQEDRKAALLLVGKVARSYHDARTGHEAAQRDFSCALCPLAFRQQLFRSFGIRLTDPQFAAIFEMMDINRDRCIDGAEFLRFFFGLGNHERAKEQRKLAVNYQARARNLRLDRLPPLAPVLGR